MNGFLRFVVFILVYQNFSSCCPLTNEGLGVFRLKKKAITDRFEAWKSRKHGMGNSYSRGNFVYLKMAEFSRVALRELHNIFPYPPKRGATTPAQYPSPSPSPSPSPHGPVLAPPSRSAVPEVARPGPTPIPSVAPAFIPLPQGNFINSSPRNNSKNHNKILIVAATVGGSVLLVLSAICVVLYQHNKTAAVRPWATGISGPLQKAFVTGVPKLKRSELVTACEDFSNVIGSSSVHTLYKGTLSSGVEIAVLSLYVTSAKDWSIDQESQFRQKIDTLSKINHKNFVNLIGYCEEEEEEPFTRMMVFEYAPNGTLFEHLHTREAEHLDWATRMRIMMGVAYCLEHLHRLTPPPLFLKTPSSSSVHLPEDVRFHLLARGNGRVVRRAEQRVRFRGHPIRDGHGSVALRGQRRCP